MEKESFSSQMAFIAPCNTFIVVTSNHKAFYDKISTNHRRPFSVPFFQEYNIEWQFGGILAIRCSAGREN